VQQYARIWSFISTVRKQGQDIWQELSNILQGYSYRLATT
jgi:hypothetical protein